MRVACREPARGGGFTDFAAVGVQGTADPIDGCLRRGVGLASLTAPRDARFLLVSWDIDCLLATVVGCLSRVFEGLRFIGGAAAPLMSEVRFPFGVMAIRGVCSCGDCVGVLAREPDAFRAIVVLMPAGLAWRFTDDIRPLTEPLGIAAPIVPFPFREVVDAIFRGIAFAADEAVASVKFRSNSSKEAPVSFAGVKAACQNNVFIQSGATPPRKEKKRSKNRMLSRVCTYLLDQIHSGAAKTMLS